MLLTTTMMVLKVTTFQMTVSVELSAKKIVNAWTVDDEDRLDKPTYHVLVISGGIQQIPG